MCALCAGSIVTLPETPSGHMRRGSLTPVKGCTIIAEGATLSWYSTLLKTVMIIGLNRQEMQMSITEQDRLHSSILAEIAHIRALMKGKGIAMEQLVEEVCKEMARRHVIHGELKLPDWRIAHGVAFVLYHNAGYTGEYDAVTGMYYSMRDRFEKIKPEKRSGGIFEWIKKILCW